MRQFQYSAKYYTNIIDKTLILLRFLQIEKQAGLKLKITMMLYYLTIIHHMDMIEVKPI